MNNYTYNPIPPRVWSRVQSSCTDPGVPNNNYLVYVSLTKQTVPQAIANLNTQILSKGNILQYKKNSATLTKQQKYAQLAKGGGPSRKKSYATQSQTYSNPNTSSLQRVNSTEIPFPNFIIGSPNNILGPYKYGLQNPNGCPATTLEEGGTLNCNTIVKPCTKQIIQQTNTQKYFSITDSNVPGFSNPSVVKFLYWDPRLQTWYPRQRYTMNNSGNKWPQNYKDFVRARNSCNIVDNINNINNIDNFIDSVLDNSNPGTNSIDINLEKILTKL